MDAALIFDIDSSRARTAATDLAKLQNAATGLSREWAKTDTAIRRSNGQFASSAETVERYGREVQDLAAKYNPALNAVYRFQQAEAELQRAVALGVLTQRQAADQLQRVQVQLAASANAATRAAGAWDALGNEMQQGSHHTSNVFAQLNDIGVMLAAGQNPFQLALQQGTQLNQVWAQMGAQGRTLGGVFGVLRGAVASMLSPMSLLTIGTIAGTAALINWATSASDADAKGLAFKDRVDELSSSISRLKEVTDFYSTDGIQKLIDRYGVLNEEILLLLERQREFATNEAMRNALASVTDDASELKDFMGEIATAITIGGSRLKQFERDWELSYQQALQVRHAVIAVNESTDVLGRSQALANLREAMRGTKLEGTEVYGVIIRAESELRSLYNVSNQGGWFNSAISGAQTLLGTIRQAASEALAAANLAKAAEGGLSDRPRGRPFELGVPELPEAPGGGGSGGGGGGQSAEDQMREEMRSRWETLNDGFQSEYMLAMQAYAKDQETLKWALDQKLISQQEYQDNLGMLYANAWQGQWEKDQLQYDMDQQALQAALDNKLIAEEDYLRKRSELNWQVVGRLGEDMSNAWAFELGNFSKHLGEMNQIAGGYDGILRAQKVFGAASALISTYTGAAEALKLPFPQNIAAAAKVLATGMGFVNAIKGSGSGGGGRGAAAAANPSVAAKQEPTREVLVRLDGDPWLVDMADSIMNEIYKQTKDGRVVVARAN